MKKQLIMAAVALGLSGGALVSTANAAPLSPAAGITDASGSLTDKVHYRRDHQRYGHHHHRDRGWRRWRPRMFGYYKHRHHHHRHHHRDYYRY